MLLTSRKGLGKALGNDPREKDTLELQINKFCKENGDIGVVVLLHCLRAVKLIFQSYSFSDS